MLCQIPLTLRNGVNSCEIIRNIDSDTLESSTQVHQLLTDEHHFLVLDEISLRLVSHDLDQGILRYLICTIEHKFEGQRMGVGCSINEEMQNQ